MTWDRRGGWTAPAARDGRSGSDDPARGRGRAFTPPSSPAVAGALAGDAGEEEGQPVPAGRPIGRRRLAGRTTSQVQRALRRSRWRRSMEWLRPRWISLIGAIGCAAGIPALLLSPLFTVEQVVVRRESASSAAAVTRATQLSQVVGHNIFLVNAQRVAQEVAMVPSVLKVRVIPRLPNVMEIEIVERRPIATWSTGTTTFLVDDQGFLLAEAGQTDGTPASASAATEGLLAVRDTTGREMQLGDQVNQRTLLAARELAKALPAAGVRPKDVEVTPQGLVFTTDAGWRIIFGEVEALNAKLANLATVADLAAKQNLKIALLDLRPKDRPLYQLAP